MKKIIATTTMLLSLATPPAFACSCLGVQPPADTWLRQVADSSTYIFFGTVQRAPASLLPGTPVAVQVKQHIKGQFRGTLVLDACPSFKISAGEERVFFVGPSGAINGCADYKYYLTNFGILKELDRILSPGA